MVAKILRGLGNPEPPLVLDDVRTLQKLERHYYSSVDDGPLREFISRAYIGPKQVFSRPTLILDVVRKFCGGDSSGTSAGSSWSRHL